MSQPKVSSRVSRYARFAGATALALSSLFSIAAVPAPSASAASAGPDDFIVVLKAGVDSRAVAAEHASRHGAGVRYVYQHALNGYAARASSGAIGAIAADGRVAYVERDQKVSTQITTEVTTQFGAPWGLDRIDDPVKTWTADGTYTYTGTGAGVTAYIIDTGIHYAHQQFATSGSPRAVFGYDAWGGSGADCNGHGTHVAGTVGGSTYGVAKQVNLVAVRVLDCAGSGSWSGVIAGINWIIGTHKAGDPAVANLSLGGGASSAVDTAVKNLIIDGVATAVAAGNGNSIGIQQDACRTSPARVAEAMTISATDSNDTKASWANYGNCVDWFAPGVNIQSSWHVDPTGAASSSATHIISGTSMATPHTAGVAALYLQSVPSATPAAVRSALAAKLVPNNVKSSRTPNNSLLQNSW